MYSTVKLVVLTAIALVWWLPNYTTATVISLENNGYKGIVVAIKSTITEDTELIDNIKELFTNASKFLHTATRGQAYFKEITIAVPSTWHSIYLYEPVYSDLFSSAQVRVDVPNPEYEDSPYTLQTGSCGEPGQYIHLTPKFVKGTHDETLEKFGPPERHLVHEWAHLRYGVFDEHGIHGDPRFPTLYRDSGKFHPTSCIKNIKGKITAKDGGPCNVLEGDFVDRSCVFVPNMHNQDVTASIMYMPSLLLIDGFCDETDERFHNVDAPTRQNVICDRRSTWSVISSHPDFNEQRNRTKRQADFEKPAFRIVKHISNEESRLVLVLDTSRSMRGQPIKLLHQAAVRFVADKVPDRTYLGIVKFSTDAKVLHNLTKVTPESRQSLINKLPSVDDGDSTAIGKGLTLGLKVLKNNTDGSAEGGMILLITDGEENVSPYIEEILPQVAKERVIVNTVAFGSQASLKLENVTKATGGKGFFFRDIQGTRPKFDLDRAFVESITSQANVDLQAVKITDDDRLSVPAYDKVTRNVPIDRELGKNTIFTILSTSINETDITITDPKGERYTSASPEYNKDYGSRNRIQVIIPKAQSGLWMAEIISKYHSILQVSLSVTSEPKDVRELPIRVRSWISDFQSQSQGHVRGAKVYAEVKKGYSAVVGAKVTATVERPVGGSIELVLIDNGAGADVMLNDGVYSAYFTQFSGDGRYAVVSDVANDGGAKLKKGTRASPSNYPWLKYRGPAPTTPSKTSFDLDDFVWSDKKIQWEEDEREEDEREDEGEPIDKFTRTSAAGNFYFKGGNVSRNRVGIPGSVRDLIRRSIIDSEQKFVTLRWTSPGVDGGDVSSIELRADLEFKKLVRSFNETFLFNDSFLFHNTVLFNRSLFNDTRVANGTLKPLPAGRRQTVTLRLPDFFFGKKDEIKVVTVCFAVVGLDQDKNVSPFYNIARATYGIRGYFIAKNEEKRKAKLKWWLTVLGIGSAVSLTIGSLVTGVLIFYKAKCVAFIGAIKQ